MAFLGRSLSSPDMYQDFTTHSHSPTYHPALCASAARSGNVDTTRLTGTESPHRSRPHVNVNNVNDVSDSDTPHSPSPPHSVSDSHSAASATRGKGAAHEWPTLHLSILGSPPQLHTPYRGIDPLSHVNLADRTHNYEPTRVA